LGRQEAVPAGHQAARLTVTLAGWRPTVTLAGYRPTVTLAGYRPTVTLAGWRPTVTLAGYRPTQFPSTHARTGGASIARCAAGSLRTMVALIGTLTRSASTTTGSAPRRRASSAT
jgi:hypothetical protein